jgi:hypothetical protein
VATEDANADMIPSALDCQGPQGSPGISGYEIVEDIVTVAGGTAHLIVVPCPPGKKVLGAGYNTDDDVIIAGHHPFDTTGTSWRTQVVNPTPVNENVRVSLICAFVD